MTQGSIMSMHKLILAAAGAAASALAASCASQGPRPNDELTKARTVIEQADKGNAQRYAAADLQRAHDELSEADRAVATGKYDEARYLAQRAEADADLATARGNAGEAQQAAHEVTESNSTLQQEADRSAANAERAPD